MAKRRRVNTSWFKRIMSDRGMTNRGLAHQLHLDESALSRRIHGHLEFTPDETVRLARLLGVSHEDVLTNLGIEAEDVTAAGKVRVVGWVDSAGVVHGRGGLRGPRGVRAPAGAEGMEAVRVQADGPLAAVEWVWAPGS